MLMRTMISHHFSPDLDVHDLAGALLEWMTVEVATVFVVVSSWALLRRHQRRRPLADHRLVDEAPHSVVAAAPH